MLQQTPDPVYPACAGSTVIAGPQGEKAGLPRMRIDRQLRLGRSFTMAWDRLCTGFACFCDRPRLPAAVDLRTMAGIYSRMRGSTRPVHQGILLRMAGSTYD